MVENFSFKKSERLRSKKQINELFSKAKTISYPPIAVLWIKIDFSPKSPIKLLISVPRKHFKKAVERNLLKRRMREAYRLNKHLIISDLIEHQISCNCAIIYNDNKLENYSVIEAKIILIFQRLKKEIMIANSL